MTRPRRHLSSLLVLIPLFSGRAVPAHAQWAPNGVGVCTATGAQTEIVAISDGTGGAFLVWQDGRAGSPGAFAQRVNGAGVAQWAPNGVQVAAIAQRPRLCSDGAGGVIVAFQGPSGVMAQRLDGSGVAQWAPGGVTLSTLTGRPRLAADGAGGAVVTWVIGSQPTRDVHAQRVNSAGAVQWGANGVAVCRHPADQRDSEVIADGTGGAIVAWWDGRSSTQRTFARRVAANGDTLWTPGGNAVSPNAAAAFAPALVADGAGGAFVVASDQRLAFGTGVFVHRLSSSGAVAAGWTADGVHVGGAGDPDPKAVAVGDGSGGVLVTRVGGEVDLVTSVAANPWSVEVVPFPTIFTMPVRVAIAADGIGGAYVAWDDFRNSTDSDVYAMHVRSDGTLNGSCPENGDPMAQLAANQLSPTVCAAGGAGAIVAWSDSRVAGADVYADLSACGATVDVPGDTPGRATAHVAAWPNPFGRDLTIAYALASPSGGPAELELLDARGRVVLRRPLVVDEGGRGVAHLAVPRNLAAGAYLVRLVQGGEAAVRKITLVR